MRPLYPVITTSVHQSILYALVALLCLAFTSNTLAAVTPTGTEITNTAVATYSVYSETYSRSDSATLTTQEVNPGPVVPTPSNIRLGHLDDNGTPLTLNGTEFGDGQGNFTPNTDFTDEDGNTVTFPASVTVSDDEFGYRAGEPVIIIV